MIATTFVYVLFLAATLLWDVRTRRIPNVLSMMGTAAGVLMHGWFPAADENAWMFPIFGAMAGLALALPLYVVKAAGAGDVKWFGAAGAFVGPADCAILIGVSVLLAGAAALCGIALSRRLRRQWMEVAAGLYIRTGTRRWQLPERTGTKFPFLVCAVPAAAALLIWNG